MVRKVFASSVLLIGCLFSSVLCIPSPPPHATEDIQEDQGSSALEWSGDNAVSRDSVQPGATTIVLKEGGGEAGFGSDELFPEVSRHGARIFVGVNAREDIPSQVVVFKEVKRKKPRIFFNPSEVLFASRAIGQRVHEAIRQLTDKFDLHFPQENLGRYPPPPGPPFQHHHSPPPPPFPLGGLFGRPPPPLPFPFPPSLFQDFPFPKPPQPPPPQHPHIPPSPSPFYYPPPPRPAPQAPPQTIEQPPPPPVDSRPPTTMGSPSQPSNRPQPPTATENPPTSTTDVWDLLLPWWYPIHQRPPPTKKPPQSALPMNATGVDQPLPAESVAPTTTTAESSVASEAVPTPAPPAEGVTAAAVELYVDTEKETENFTSSVGDIIEPSDSSTDNRVITTAEASLPEKEENYEGQASTSTPPVENASESEIAGDGGEKVATFGEDKEDESISSTAASIDDGEGVSSTVTSEGEMITDSAIIPEKQEPLSTFAIEGESITTTPDIIQSTVASEENEPTTITGVEVTSEPILEINEETTDNVDTNPSFPQKETEITTNANEQREVLADPINDEGVLSTASAVITEEDLAKAAEDNDSKSIDPMLNLFDTDGGEVLEENFILK